MSRYYHKLTTNQLTQFRKPSQAGFSKSQMLTKFHNISEIRFDGRQLTFFSGIITLQRYDYPDISLFIQLK